MYDYEYDNNGNMIVDERKDLQFDYNFLNLLSRAVANSDTTDVKTVYRWLADGTKLGVSDASGDNGYEYLGSLIYRKTPSGTELESTGFRQGRFVNASGGIQIRYHLTDHLGSIRTIIDETGAVVATNDYYTFGKRWDDPQSLNASSNRWLYNGKEIQETGNLDLLDYGARMYDPYTGRWLTQDPLAEVFPWESPFSYAFNNPINLIDMFGLAPKKPDSQQDEIDGDTLPEVVVTVLRDDPWIEWLSLRPELEFAPDIDVQFDLNIDEQESTTSTKVLQATGAILLFLIVDDTTVIGIADDVLIFPVAGLGAIIGGVIWIFEKDKGIGFHNMKPHTKGKRGSTEQKHTATRAGGDPENGRYGEDRNDNRGNKNKKYIPPKNPNKRK